MGVREADIAVVKDGIGIEILVFDCGTVDGIGGDGRVDY